MKEALSIDPIMVKPNNLNLTEIIQSYRQRLWGFIRKRVPNEADAEDILQDVFYQFLDSSQLMRPIEQLSGWLFTVARNKITDLYRKKKPEPLERNFLDYGEDEQGPDLGDFLFDPDNNPESTYLRTLVWRELDEALEELSPEQREVFELHEMEGLSFKEISEMTGEGVNTLLSRKRYAVLHLRDRLRNLYDQIIHF
ncbi:MAG: RNA polymerase sigma factor [Chitinophagaceae bacterium]